MLSNVQYYAIAIVSIGFVAYVVAIKLVHVRVTSQWLRELEGSVTSKAHLKWPLKLCVAANVPTVILTAVMGGVGLGIIMVAVSLGVSRFALESYAHYIMRATASGRRAQALATLVAIMGHLITLIAFFLFASAELTFLLIVLITTIYSLWLPAAVLRAEVFFISNWDNQLRQVCSYCEYPTDGLPFNSPCPECGKVSRNQLGP